MASMNAVSANPMTIAVSTIACGSGSAISSTSLWPMIGGPPARPPDISTMTLTP